MKIKNAGLLLNNILVLVAQKFVSIVVYVRCHVGCCSTNVGFFEQVLRRTLALEFDSFLLALSCGVGFLNISLQFRFVSMKNKI